MTKRLIFVMAILVFALPFAVMAQDATPEPTPEVEPIELEAVDALAVDGDILVAGSSTVFPLTERMAERFAEEGFSGNITVDSIGTGAGFERFCVAGETDISNASRAIRDSEVESCRAIGREPIEFRVGTDALAVVVSVDNDFVESLTIEQLSAIYSGAVTMWSEVDPMFPAETIQVFSPGSDSGTYDYFLEATLETEAGGDLEAEAAEAAIQSVPGIQFSEDDNVLVQGVEGSPYAIGYFGFAYYIENREFLRSLAIDGGDGAVAPNEESAEDGTYPISRPLYIYSDATIMAEKPQVAAFISFYLSNVNDEVIDVGYFPASVEALNEAKQAYLDATMGGM